MLCSPAFLWAQLEGVSLESKPRPRPVSNFPHIISTPRVPIELSTRHTKKDRTPAGHSGDLLSDSEPGEPVTVAPSPKWQRFAGSWGSGARCARSPAWWGGGVVQEGGAEVLGVPSPPPTTLRSPLVTVSLQAAETCHRDLGPERHPPFTSPHQAPRVHVHLWLPPITAEFAVGRSRLRRNRSGKELGSSLFAGRKVQPGNQSSALGVSGKFPRFLAWQETFRSLEVPAVPSSPSPFPLPPSLPIFPICYSLEKCKTWKLQPQLLSRCYALCMQTLLVWNVPAVAEGGAVWSFLPTPKLPLVLAVLAPCEVTSLKSVNNCVSREQ
ncbi:uncharacterized protein LOC132519051 [Lagenorhynchus albirostris]|uniref:uncharacterized protein LOC132519051 n=1 Tax=Lagenorhynchus albirostris TaxID=27610 RepID=UPI0028EA02DF|nr:uncharacterized protein LOC132519051 [Lagenorhynchus albirostris]